MPKFRHALFPLLLLSGCQTPIGESWNRTVSKLTPDRTAEREERYGLRPSPSGQNSNSVAAPSEKKKSDRPTTTVVLKPFRKSSPSSTSSSQPVKVKPSPTPTQKDETVTAKPESKPTPEPGPPPFASPVPGKKGYVTSPFSPGSGFIDVEGLEPGSEAKDPYTGKVFRVP